jgi:hypothetical protein
MYVRLHLVTQSKYLDCHGLDAFTHGYLLFMLYSAHASWPRNGPGLSLALPGSWQESGAAMSGRLVFCSAMMAAA